MGGTRDDGRPGRRTRYPAAPENASRVVRATEPDGPRTPKLLDRVRQTVCARRLGIDLPWLDGLVPAKRPAHLPVVPIPMRVRAVLGRIEGVPRLVAVLLYAAGLRLLEC
jgi:hypothetical protein